LLLEILAHRAQLALDTTPILPNRALDQAPALPELALEPRARPANRALEAVAGGRAASLVALELTLERRTGAVLGREANSWTCLTWVFGCVELVRAAVVVLRAVVAALRRAVVAGLRVVVFLVVAGLRAPGLLVVAMLAYSFRSITKDVKTKAVRWRGYPSNMCL
jgi:hypothetical protein